MEAVIPARSKQQYKFFKAMANNPKLAKKHGMTTEEAKEYISENKGKKRFSKLVDKVRKK